MGLISRREMMVGSAAVLATSASLRHAHAADSTWDRIQSTGTLRLGVIPNRPPYFWLESGKWVGFSTQMGEDLAEALSKTMNKPIKIEFVETNFTTIILDLQADKLDIFFGLSYSEQRDKAVHLVGPLYELPEVALTAGKKALGDQWDTYNKPEVKVSVVMGTTDEQAVRRLLPKSTVRAMKGTPEAILDVQSGNGDAWVTTVLVGLGALKESKTFDAMHVLQPVFMQPSHGGTRRDGDGKFAAYSKEWAPKYRSTGRAKEVIFAAMRKYGLDVDRLPPGVNF
jgi:polar amino acid transport system substrate-binding protein